MPRHVDHDDRRRAIIKATLTVLAEHGPQGLSFRAVTEEMGGGSSTLVTHYFPSRQSLLDALVGEYLADWPEEIAALEQGSDDPRERLRLFLQWLLPLDAQSQIEERGRLNLLGERQTRLRTQHLFDTWDANVRGLLAQHLDGLVPADRIAVTTDLLRTVTNGLTLTWAEHPDEWPPERMTAIVDEALGALDLLPDSVTARATS